MTPPKAFLIDIGNVLARFDFGPLATRLAADCSPAPTDPLGAILDIKDQLENGELDEAAFVELARARLGYRGNTGSFLALWCDIFSENLPMTRLVAALSGAGYPLYLLSNTNGPHLRYLRENYSVFTHFHGGIYSHEAGALKPHEPIFHAAIERYALVSGETLYIDDLAANIATGQSLGFLTHLYDPDRHDALEALLAEMGVALPRPR